MAMPPSWEGPGDEQGPAPGISFATPGARLVAYIVDILIGSVLVIPVALATLVAFAIVGPLGLLVALLGSIAIALYFPYFWQKSGQTPGMRLMQIKVVRDIDGGPISWGPAILRLIGYAVNLFVFYIGYIWIFIDKRKRGWHDLIAGTVVVKAPDDLLS